MPRQFRKITLQVRSKEDPEKWNTINSYSHENRLVISGNWTHKQLRDHAVNQMAQWQHNSRDFDGREMRVHIEGEEDVTPFVLADANAPIRKPPQVKPKLKRARR